MADATLTLNLRDRVSVPFSARRARVWVTLNVDQFWDEDGILRVDAGKATVDDNGLVTITGVPIASSSTNPTSCQATIHYEIADVRLPGQRGITKLRDSLGPFTITEDADLSTLVEEQAVPPTYLTQVTQALDEKVAQAEAFKDQAEAITGLPTEAAAQAYNIENDEGVRNALSASTAELVDETVGVNLTRAGSLEDALAALAPPSEFSDDDPSSDYALRGGGKIVLNPGAVYTLSGVVELPSRTVIEGNGAVIVATTSDAQIRIVGSPGNFNPNSVRISALTLDGDGIATTIIDFGNCIFSKFDHLTVTGCTDDGAVSDGAEWNEWNACMFTRNGGRGFFGGPYNELTTAVPAFNNNHFSRCQFSANGTIGKEIRGGHNNVFTACTFQFNGQVGSKVSAPSGGTSRGFGNLYVGGHWEGQLIHAHVENTLGTGTGPQDTTFLTPYFSTSTGHTQPQRFLVNEGTDTRVLSASSPNNSLAVKDGVRAAFQQHSTLGSLRMYGYHRIIGVAPALDGMFCNESGVVTDPEASSTPKIRVIRDATQQETTYFAKQILSGSLAGTAVLNALVSGDAAARFLLRASGALEWGDGTNATDAILSRFGAAILQLQGSLRPSTTAGYDLGTSSGYWRHVYARSVVRVPSSVSHSVDGARALTSTTGPAWVALSANITSMTFSDPGVSGFEFEVTLIQDATGGRTYVWPTNAKFAGGSAPNDTTAARRTTVGFRYNATTGNWYEIYRAVSVAG